MKELLLKILEEGQAEEMFYIDDVEYISTREVRERLARWLLSNGVIVLPCKIGEKLYDCGEFFLEGCSCPEIYELQDDEMTIHKRPHDYGYRFTYDSMYIGHDDIGNHIFRTREEAERALKERGDE